MYQLFIEATMNCLSTNLTIVAILILLTILLVRGVRGGGVDFIDNSYEGSSHDHYRCDDISISDVQPECKATRHRLIVRVHSQCKVDVFSLKCAGYCTSGVDIDSVESKNSTILKMVKYYSCCKPRTISYQQKELYCYTFGYGWYKVLTGEKVKISFPVGMKCDCTITRRIRWLQSVYNYARALN